MGGSGVIIAAYPSHTAQCLFRIDISMSATGASRVPLSFDDWSVRPMSLNAAKHGERAEFWDNFYGSPTVVERMKFDEHEDGCIAYTKHPIPTNTAWRIELLKTTECWQRGLVSEIFIL